LVRAILLDEDDRLVLIKRMKPGRTPYWTTPGGGLESTDVSLRAGLRRELPEELGAEADRFAQVFLFTAPAGEPFPSSTSSPVGYFSRMRMPVPGRSSLIHRVVTTSSTTSRSTSCLR